MRTFRILARVQLVAAVLLVGGMVAAGMATAFGHHRAGAASSWVTWALWALLGGVAISLYLSGVAQLKRPSSRTVHTTAVNASVLLWLALNGSFLSMRPDGSSAPVTALVCLGIAAVVYRLGLKPLAARAFAEEEPRP
jgi:hypothetical protein